MKKSFNWKNENIYIFKYLQNVVASIKNNFHSNTFPMYRKGRETFFSATIRSANEWSFIHSNDSIQYEKVRSCSFTSIIIGYNRIEFPIKALWDSASLHTLYIFPLSTNPQRSIEKAKIETRTHTKRSRIMNKPHNRHGRFSFGAQIKIALSERRTRQSCQPSAICQTAAFCFRSNLSDVPRERP